MSSLLIEVDPTQLLHLIAHKPSFSPPQQQQQQEYTPRISPKSKQFLTKTPSKNKGESSSLNSSNNSISSSMQTRKFRNRRRLWTKDEDSTCLKLILAQLDEVKTVDRLSWTRVAKELLEYGMNRTSKQCRERWRLKLNPENTASVIWTKEEEELLEKLQESIGNRWSVIAKQLPGRNEHSCKSHFRCILRSRKRKSQVGGSVQPSPRELKSMSSLGSESLSEVDDEDIEEEEDDDEEEEEEEEEVEDEVQEERRQELLEKILTDEDSKKRSKSIEEDSSDSQTKRLKPSFLLLSSPSSALSSSSSPPPPPLSSLLGVTSQSSLSSSQYFEHKPILPISTIFGSLRTPSKEYFARAAAEILYGKSDHRRNEPLLSSLHNHPLSHHYQQQHRFYTTNTPPSSLSASISNVGGAMQPLLQQGQSLLFSTSPSSSFNRSPTHHLQNPHLPSIYFPNIQFEDNNNNNKNL